MTVNEFTFPIAIRQFWIAWELEDKQDLTITGFTYFYLCNVWHNKGMPRSFRLKNKLICADLHISRPTFDKHRAILKKNKLIVFSSSGNGDMHITYSILQLPVTFDKDVGIDNPNQKVHQHDILKRFDPLKITKNLTNNAETESTDKQDLLTVGELKIVQPIVRDVKQDVNGDVKQDVNGDVKQDVNEDVKQDVKSDVKQQKDFTSDFTSKDSFKDSNEFLKDPNDSFKNSNDFNNIRFLKEEKKDFVVVVKGEIKNFIFFENEFLMDSALQTYCKDQGLAAADFSPALKKWMLLNEKKTYENMQAARKHFMFWLPYHQLNFKQNEYRKQYTVNRKNTPPRRKTSEDYAKGL